MWNNSSVGRLISKDDGRRTTDDTENKFTSGVSSFSGQVCTHFTEVVAETVGLCCEVDLPFTNLTKFEI